MKQDEIATLVKYRLEQAQIALADAQFLLDGNLKPAEYRQPFILCHVLRGPCADAKYR